MKRVRTARQAVRALKTGTPVEVLLDQKDQPKRLIRDVSNDIPVRYRVRHGSHYRAVQFVPVDE